MTDGTGRRVLVVEDEAMIVMLLEDMLTMIGYEVARVAYSLEDALKAAEGEQVDVAILDINLKGEASFPVAGILRTRGIPYFFATGYGTTGGGEDFRDVLVLKKPFDVDELAEALSNTLNRPNP